MRVLCDNENVAQRDYVILQRFTIIASFIDVIYMLCHQYVLDTVLFSHCDIFASSYGSALS